MIPAAFHESPSNSGGGVETALWVKQVRQGVRDGEEGKGKEKKKIERKIPPI